MKHTEQLERDAERTRQELSNSIEELRVRLTPGGVLDEVIDYASDGGVGDYVRSLKHQIIDNPVPLGLMGASLAWLVVASAFERKAGGRTRERAERDFGADVQVADANLPRSTAGSNIADASRRAVHDLGDEIAAVSAGATRRASEFAHEVRAATGQVSDRVHDATFSVGVSLAAAGGTIADKAGRGAEVIGGVASEIGSSSSAAHRAVSDFAHKQPLIVAAAGLVLGAIIGAVLPSTEAEDRLVGDTSAAAKEKLREMAGEQYAKAKDIAVSAVEAGRNVDGKEPSSFNSDPERQDNLGSSVGRHAGAEQVSEDVPIGSEDTERMHASGA